MDKPTIEIERDPSIKAFEISIYRDEVGAPQACQVLFYDDGRIEFKEYDDTAQERFKDEIITAAAGTRS